MGRGIHRLSPGAVNTTKVGMHADGGGLYLRVKNGKGGVTRSWLFRYGVGGKEHHCGLGSVNTISLAQAREAARDARQLLVLGEDPIANKRATLAQKRVAALPTTTFKQTATQYIASHEKGWRSAKHSADWTVTLDRFVHPVIGALPVQAITTDLVLKCIEPIWEEKTETASRLRGRIELILDAAKARGLRTEENPARWRGHLDTLLPKPSKVKLMEHHEALPFEQVGAFMAELRKLDGPAPRALEFLVLTAARAGEVRLATWEEMKGNVWTIPASRMKAGREHRVPLCARARQILDEMPRTASELVFPGHGGPAGLRRVLARMGRDVTVHGFRSTFRDWCGARSNFPREVAEMALAHRIGNATEQAYARHDLFEKRRRLMDAWAKFCSVPMVEVDVETSSSTAKKVVRLHA